ncbi:MAG: ribbon-helix-helix protein, CopG family [Nitrospinae bacterium]|nr:ribbon-helix-helix protein, CopG family [Nitrospinota bacterium]
MLAVRLDKELEARLEELAKKTHRTKSHYMKEALRRYLDENEDYEIGLSRLRDHADKSVPAREMRKRVGL